VSALVNTFFEQRVEQLFDLAQRIDAAFLIAGLDYRIVGGLAAYLYVEEIDPDAGRLTRDVDIAIRREDLAKIDAAVRPLGLEYCHGAGIDMLVQSAKPSAARSVHLIFAGEKVRPEYSESAPQMGNYRTIRGLRVILLADLVRMKLTSFRARDEAHLKDLDSEGLITPEIEATLPDLLRERLARMRARD
jgi:hypothetical protein